MYTKIDKLASAIHNNIVGGLSGFHHNYSLSLDLLKDEIILERLTILNEYKLKGIPFPKDLYLSINCIQIDCDHNMDLCPCNEYIDCEDNIPHFEIPLIVENSISYIGSTDKMIPFVYYTSPVLLKNHKYRKRGKNKPFVWVDMTPNENGKFDCFLFNAPLLDQVSITAIFKDIRQLLEYNCCLDLLNENMSSIDSMIIDRVTKKMLAYYRQYYMPPVPNNQTYTPG